MNERSVQHTTFVIERTYGASPARVFAAWANPEAKAQWFPKADEFDFRVGGREFNRGTHEGVTYTYDAHYQDIVPDQRIAYTYIMDRDETRISVSVTTVEFQKSATGTRLIYTEQGAFFDGEDKPEYREQGTKSFLDALDAVLQRERMPEESKH
ncbi:SRPBCC family protein [Ktedonobacter racemifer]|uniref:Activator of Hsp90 ATPase 1 family protein n=1 Tax=Ktedonobacter racemifer DSM 44963 TaxID=485913 RepID=D6TTC2_KTERA|nr:SRPBCC family protein [Ktedonobacter racemifer]EFH83673.1 Activator of Hsp90 ATPase 1 family protein [Ktedonobacter racemifer DSM 44963]